MDPSEPPDPPRPPGGDAPARRPVVRTVAGVLVGTTVVVAAVALLVLGINVLLAAFGGVLLAILLRALTDLVKGHLPMRDGLALTLVLVVLALALGGAGLALAPQIDAQLGRLGETGPRVADQVQGFLEETAWGRRVLDQVYDGELPERVPQRLGTLLAGLTEWGTWALTGLFVGLFAAANPRLYRRAIVQMFPLHGRDRAGEALDTIAFTLRWWLIGQAMAMVVIGVSTMLVLWAFGIPLALLMGLLVGLLGFIPYLGPFIGAVPVGLLAATQGADTLFYVMVAYTAVQLFEGYVAPR